MSRLIKGAETWNKLVSHPRVVVKMRRDIMVVEVSPKQQGVSGPIRTPNSGFLWLEEKSPNFWL